MKLATLLALVLAPLFAPRTMSPSYIPTPLESLALRAEFVILAKIEKLEGDNLSLTVERNLAGTPPEPRYLIVPKFRDWTCASRWKEYEVGQRCVFFLRRPREGKHPRPHGRILGAADEGELPIVTRKVKGVDRDFAILHGSRVEGLEPRDHRVHGTTLRGTELPLDELALALHGLREHFRVTMDERHPDHIAKIEALADSKTVKAFVGESDLRAHLVRKTREYAEALAKREE